MAAVNRKELLGLQMSALPVSERSGQPCGRADGKGAAGPAGTSSRHLMLCLCNNQKDNVLLAGQGRNTIMLAENQKIKR